MNADLKAIITGAVVGIISWFAFLNWSVGTADPTRTLPWETWQMAVFGVVVALGAVWFTVKDRLAIAVSYAFAASITTVLLFVITVQANDVTGLFMVGAFMILVGMMTLLVATSFVTAGIVWLVRRNRTDTSS
ncbi:hypothetical protein C1Y63_09895 [Corynebacterium sp. 13CS0277]|uniref:hypothetical protein n=1 Tax=Corynebacterium sp. 13CS0277 TaxID=2071994 RepID=UPI000D02BB89|nr:hypothetical protein [Corynebacterium sp. 13CS0277]PRQ10760.1 hypothetical protein C1Y63_09895 [Corynebacterium sp. 13CS0277]